MRCRLLVLVVLLSGLLASTPARAAEISLVSVVDGNFLNLEVRIADFDDLIAFEFLVSFDASLSAFRGVNRGPLLSPLTSFIGYSPSDTLKDANGDEVLDADGFPILVPIPDFTPVTVLGVVTGLAPGISTDGVLARLVFESLGASPGLFQLTPLSFFDSQGLIPDVVVVPDTAPIPEPSTIGLLGIGLAALARKRVRRRRQQTA